jgi:hypothetical protein
MTTAPDTTWLYVQIKGMDKLRVGSVLEVAPVVSANGVMAQVDSGCSNTITYKTYQYGYQERD